MEGRTHALKISWSALDKVRAQVRDVRSFVKSILKVASLSGSADGPSERIERFSSHTWKKQNNGTSGTKILRMGNSYRLNMRH